MPPRRRPDRSRAEMPAAATPEENPLQRIERAKELRFSGYAGMEPYFGRDAAGRWGGVCIELAEQLARFLAVEFRVVETTPADAPAELAAGRLDLGCDSNAAPEADSAVERSRPLFDDFCVLVGHGKFAAPTTWDALDVPETTIAVGTGSPEAALVQRLVVRATITGFRTRQDAVSAVLSGRSDAFPAPVFAALLERKRHPALGPPVFPSPYMPMQPVLAMAAEPEHRLRDLIDKWHAENRGKFRDWILSALAKYGIDAKDLPPQISL
ncbi:MAG TPA: transporter substrate-binding domain-containing protein [Stellaceae bacterium]|nr:transporter substrate-binding domain-containing protein [Stellaceae bacterium]